MREVASRTASLGWLIESPEWEKQYVFYALLVKKLPKLKIDDNTQGLLEDIDFDKYRIVKEEERAIVLENENTSVGPIPVGTGGGKPEPEMDALSNIVKDFNDTYGNIEWKNRDEVQSIKKHSKAWQNILI